MRPQLLAGDRVGPAAVRERVADLAVGDGDHGQQERDRDRDLDREQQRAGAGEDEHPEDLLRRVGRRRDRVGAEDRQREALRQAFADLLVGRERAAEHPRLGAAHRATERRARDRRLAPRDELVGAGVAEVGRVVALDADAPVARLAAGDGSATADHGWTSRCRGYGRRTRISGWLRPRCRCGCPPRSAAPGVARRPRGPGGTAGPSRARRCAMPATSTRGAPCVATRRIASRTSRSSPLHGSGASIDAVSGMDSLITIRASRPAPRGIGPPTAVRP